MCGLNGVFAYNPAANLPSDGELLVVRDHMRSRGPDGQGEWWTQDRRLGLGHRRLAILDLSHRSDQPLESACGRFVVVFNGEIYNYPELRGELERQGRTFSTDSDTEVLLHLYELNGAEMVRHLRGMFAFAIWDNQQRTLFLARDPYGIKPLYIANDGWTLRFASQVKALLASGRVSRDPEPAGIVGFHIWGSVPEPFTLYREIRSLPAGHTQIIDEAGPQEPKSYTSIALIMTQKVNGTASDLGDVGFHVRNAALESVRAHLLADVEVGLFLSAGVDSGALLGLMRDAGQRKIRAVTLGFEEFCGSPEDEVPAAARVAAFYGAEHVVRIVAEAEFREDLPNILASMDQPSIDGVNSWFVAKAAKEAGLKVALSGIGGDELLAGYPSFRDVPRWTRWMRFSSLIPGLGPTARIALRSLGLAERYPKVLGLTRYRGSYASAYLLRRALYLPFELEQLLEPEMLRTGLRRLQPLKLLNESMTPDPGSPIGRIAALESTQYMRNQLLRDADWAGMAHSLEIRTPLVDVKLLSALAPFMKHFGRGAGKQALASAPSLKMPADIVQRQKSGFGVPVGEWIAAANGTALKTKGAISREWAPQVLADSSLPQSTSGQVRKNNHRSST